MGRDTSSATALAPGFRFHPTDEELVSYYLKRKVCGKTFRINAISEVDIYKSEPWELPCKSRLKGRDQEWYFFSALDKKYGNGARMNRATGNGYWKATGKDRTVCHDNRIFGMKKTLVFHSGRAPDGKRTDWVMHEYRLVDEELERAGATQDAYVLCRVFQKSGLGPPNGSRYAPFVEEEWEDEEMTLVPGEEPVEEKTPVDDACIEANGTQQDSLAIEEATQNGSKETQNHAPVSKSERLNDGPEHCVVNREAPFPIIQYKRRRQNDLDSNGSDNSTRTAHNDHTSSTTTTSAATTTTTTTIAIAATTTMSTTVTTTTNTAYVPSLPLLEPAKENPKQEVADLNSVLPSCCVKYINNLQNEIHKKAIERETMKLEMLSAQAMINILQSRMEYLSKENADLRRCIRGASF